MSDPLDAALTLAAMGFAVFPAHPGAKTPLTRHGYKDATCDAEQLRRWWTATPGANVALATDGLLVVDVDGSENTWPSDPSQRSELEAAPSQITPRGGRHYILRAPEGRRFRNTANRLAAHVDTRADGGYILVPPSVVEGHPYTWQEAAGIVPRAEMPLPLDWLLAALDAAQVPAAPAISSMSSADASPEGDLARAAAYVASVPAATEGERNAALNGLAFRLMERFRLAERAHRDLCLDWARRCTPPLPDAEALRTIRSAWSGACARGAAGSKRTEGPMPGHGGVRPIKLPAEGDLPPALPLWTSARDLVRGGTGLRPPLVHGLLRETETLDLIGPSKARKSFLVLDLALAAAARRYCLGECPLPPRYWGLWFTPRPPA